MSKPDATDADRVVLRTSNERLRFEVWAQKEGFAVPGYDLNNGRYFDEAFHWMWFAWKSRAETHAHETCEQRYLKALQQIIMLSHEFNKERNAYAVKLEEIAHEAVTNAPNLNAECSACGARYEAIKGHRCTVNALKAVEQPSPVDDAEFGTAEWRAANPESEGDQRGE